VNYPDLIGNSGKCWQRPWPKRQFFCREMDGRIGSSIDDRRHYIFLGNLNI